MHRPHRWRPVHVFAYARSYQGAGESISESASPFPREQTLQTYSDPTIRQSALYSAWCCCVPTMMDKRLNLPRGHLLIHVNTGCKYVRAALSDATRICRRAVG